MRNKIIEKAQELGQLIANCSEADRVKTAGDRMNANDEAVDILQAYNDSRREATERLRAIGNPSKEEIEAFRAEDMAEFEKLMQNDLIKEYIEANQEMENLVNQVNAVLTYFIQGGQDGEMGAGGSCSGNCSSCGGCN